MCNKWLSDIINSYFACLIFTSLILYSLLLTVHIRIRNCFHPFFSILFGLVVFFYQLCALCVGIQRIFYLTLEDKKTNQTQSFSRVFEVIELSLEYIVNASYAAITPLFLCCLIERIVATLASQKYEHCRPYTFLIGMFIFVGVVTYFQGVEDVTIGDAMINTYVEIALSLAILVTLAVLFFFNQRLIRKKSNHNLSVKYQLTENVRVVRNALIPIVLCDTAITLNDLVGEEVFDKEFIFKPEKCAESPLYVYAFVLMNTISLALEFAIPLLILCRWEVYKKVLPNCLTRTHDVNRVDALSTSHPSIIRNVFGEAINQSDSPNAYFDRLKMEWDRI